MTHRTALATIEPSLAGSLDRLDPMNLALAGHLARYTGSTLKIHQSSLKIYLGWCAAEQVTPLTAMRPHLELYLRWLERQGWAESTVSLRFGVVCTFYAYCADEDLVVKDPTRRITRPTVHRESQRRTFLGPLEFAQLLTAARKEGPTAHALVALLGMSGLRISEALGLDVESITVISGYDVLSFIGKGDKPAKVPMPIPVMRAVHAAIDGRESGPILLSGRGARMDRSAARRLLTKVATAAQITTTVSPHSLRRTFCTSGLVSGVPLNDMRLAMRHSDTKTTALYDMAAGSLDRNATHRVAAYLAGMTG